MIHRAALASILLLVAAPSLADDPSTGPLIEGYGPTYPINDRHVPLPEDFSYKAVFDLAVYPGPQNPKTPAIRNKMIVALLIALLGLAWGFQIEGKIDNKGINSLLYQDINLRVIGVNGYQSLGFPDAKGNFKVHVQQPGTYKVELFHTAFNFEPVVVEIASDEQVEANPNKKRTSAFLYKTKDAGKGLRLLYPLDLEPSHKIKYFEAEQPFNPWTFVKDPYFLMIGFGVVMMYMMKAVPKEEMEEYQKQQSDQMKQCQQ